MIDRRRFLNGLVTTGAAGVLGVPPSPAAAEPPPESRRVRLLHRPTLCEAAQYVAEDLLRGEGFTDVQYVKRGDAAPEDALGTGEADISMLFSPPMILRVDAGAPIVFLGGVHVGCVEIFTNDRVRTARDLRGKRIAINQLGLAPHIVIAVIAAHVGIDPAREIDWVIHPFADWERLLVEGKIDAYLSFPPYAQATRARKVGRVILNTLTDRPWSQYFCCMIVANKDFVRRAPVATKRAMRAILKGTDRCAQEPEQVARFLVDKGYVERSEYAVQSLKEVAYGRWRDYDPEDAVRFYALRLREAGLIKSNPQKILAQATDWRFFNELRKELKG